MSVTEIKTNFFFQTLEFTDNNSHKLMLKYVFIYALINISLLRSLSASDLSISYSAEDLTKSCRLVLHN